MKKIIFSLLFTFTLMFISNVESKGQCSSCPTNFTPKSVNVTINGCNITIYYCKFCEPTGYPSAKLCGVYFPTSCGNLVIDYDFWYQVREALIIDLSIDCNKEIGPCPERQSFSIEEGFCLGIYPNHPQNPTGYIIKNCDGQAVTCYKKYEVCYEGSELVYSIVDTQITPAGCDVMEFEFDPNDPPYYCFTFCP